MVYDLLRKASTTTYKSKEDRKKEIEEQNRDILELVNFIIKVSFKYQILRKRKKKLLKQNLQVLLQNKRLQIIKMK